MEIVIFIIFTGLLLVLAFGGILYSLHLEEHAFSNCREPQNDVPHSGAGSEQNPQPRLASEERGCEVPGNVGAAVGNKMRGRLTVDHQPHKLDSEGSTPSPATTLTRDQHNAYPKGRWS